MILWIWCNNPPFSHAVCSCVMLKGKTPTHRSHFQILANVADDVNDLEL